jgi:hypothetical protein
MNDEALVEAVVSPWRESDSEGRTRAHPAWFDLDDAGRELAFQQASAQRRLEAATDARGWSGTVRAVLARLP